MYNLQLPLKAGFVLLLTTLVFGFIYSMLPERHFGFENNIDPYYFATTNMSNHRPKTQTAKIIVMIQQLLLLCEFYIFVSCTDINF